jgi:hypothetical protein
MNESALSQKNFGPSCSNYDKFCRIICFAKLYVYHLYIFFFSKTGHRFSNFIVGVTDDKPNKASIAQTQYHQCGQYGNVEDGEICELACGQDTPPGRYIIVLIPKLTPLMICELEVYGGMYCFV